AYHEDRPGSTGRAARLPSKRRASRAKGMANAMTAPTMITSSSRPLKANCARDLGPLFVNNPHRMIGQDGAFSIPLEPGRALWFFGDTLIGRRVPGQSLWYIDGQPVGHADMSGKGQIDRMINNTGLILNHSTG